MLGQRPKHKDLANRAVSWLKAIGKQMKPPKPSSPQSVGSYYSYSSLADSLRSDSAYPAGGHAQTPVEYESHPQEESTLCSPTESPTDGTAIVYADNVATNTSYELRSSNSILPSLNPQPEGSNFAESIALPTPTVPDDTTHGTDGRDIESTAGTSVQFTEVSTQPEAQEQRNVCEAKGCKEMLNLSWCNICNITVCGKCWRDQAAHTASRYPVHEMTTLELRDTIWSILRDIEAEERFKAQAATMNDRERAEFLKQMEEHKVSELRRGSHTMWFGVSFSGDGHPMKLDCTSRYSDISIGMPLDKYPALISFVGETGAGKSTLIRALLKIKCPPTKFNSLETPVVGSTLLLSSPTSSDVHMFPDPSTEHHQRPLLYADCEGLQGGTKPPLGDNEYIRRARQRFKGDRLRDLTIRLAQNSEKFSRNWVVKSLYPKILFTFSDVVCYVTTNFRTIEAVLVQLIRWADAVFQTSVNQPVLPYAIVVVNALDSIDSAQWFNEGVTDNILKRLAQCIHTDPWLGLVVKEWNHRGKNIEDIKELILCYYSGVKIICIPHMRSAPSLIKKQYEMLDTEIQWATEKLKEMRKDAVLLLDSEELDIYFNYAFEHFANNFSEPFNFLNAALERNPVRAACRDHIINAATRIMKIRDFETGAQLFEKLAPLLASSILLDMCRKGYPGRSCAESIDPALEMYRKYCRSAKEEFHQSHWPCAFRDRKGRRCVNVSTKHKKGHQIKNGKVVATGDYIPESEPGATNDVRETDPGSVSDVSVEGSNIKNSGLHFIVLVEQEYNNYLKCLGEQVCSRSAVSAIHLKVLARDEYANMWASDHGKDGDAIFNDFSSHSTCFGCLCHVPNHVLPCGHVLCDLCIDDFSESPKSHELRVMRRCPLCRHEQQPFEWKLKREPPQAAPRILSLDGGGVRSIVQLRILSALEEKVDLGLPIHDFFDLVVGTSAGGIIALEITEGCMSAKECYEMFYGFAKEAFKPRIGSRIPLIKYLVEARHHSRYESRGLDKALKKSLGEAVMFGETKLQSTTKAAVTVATANGKPTVLANYNRAPSNKPCSYDFLRAENKKLELKVWEAARATSAAPRYFKPFFHKATGRYFLDGALCYNNPVHVADSESKLVWPQHEAPDFILSIGTGAKRAPEKADFDRGGIQDQEAEADENVGVGHLKRLKTIIAHQIGRNMDAEKAWEEFIGSRPMASDGVDNGKYLRINPRFSGNVPELDKVEDLDYLGDQAKQFCDQEEDLISAVAAKLIASLFYMRLESSGLGPSKTDMQLHNCKGTILCRLEAGSESLKGLCKKISNDRGPVDSIFWIESGPEEFNQPLLSDATSLCDSDGAFKFETEFSVPHIDEPIRIYLSSSGPRYPHPLSLINGFPCSLRQLKKLSK